jgi:hypothetical protein
MAVDTGILRFPHFRQRVVRSIAVSLFVANQPMEQKFQRRVVLHSQGKSSMEAAIERVMKTYGMIVNLTLAQERAVREKVSRFLEVKSETDEQKLTIEGLRYVRGLSVADL